MSSTFAVDLSKVPSIGIILDPHGNFPAWRLKVEDHIEGRYGGPATAILTNVDYVLSRPKPNKDDIDFDIEPARGDDPYLKYGREVPAGAPSWQGYLDTQINRNKNFSDVGRARYWADFDAYLKEKQSQANYDTFLTALFKYNMSEASKRIVKVHPDYLPYQAHDQAEGRSSLAYFRIIVETHSTGNYATKLYRTIKFFNYTQGDKDHEEYAEGINAGVIALKADFGSTDPRFDGYIKIVDIAKAIYLYGVSQKFFHSKVDDVVKDIADGDPPDLYELMNQFQAYMNSKFIAAPDADPDTAFAATSGPQKRSAPYTGDPCPCCTSYGRTKIAANHGFETCYLNPSNKAGFNPKALKQAEATRKEYEKKHGTTTSTATKTTSKTAAKDKKADPVKAYIAHIAQLNKKGRGKAMQAVVDALPDEDDEDEDEDE